MSHSDQPAQLSTNKQTVMTVAEQDTVAVCYICEYEHKESYLDLQYVPEVLVIYKGDKLRIVKSECTCEENMW